MTNPPYTIRPVQPTDYDQLEALMLAYIVDFYQAPAPAQESLRDLISKLQAGEIGQQFVAEGSAELLGFVTLYYSYSTLRARRTTIMNDLYVTAAARGTGVASDLFQTALSFTRQQDCASMSWETAHDNHRAQRFYEKMGGTKGDWLNYSIS